MNNGNAISSKKISRFMCKKTEIKRKEKSSNEKT